MHLLPTLVLASSLAAPVEDPTDGHAVDASFGPLIGGQDLVLDVRTTAPDAPVYFFLGFASVPSVSSNPLIPPVGVSPATSFTILQTDAQGRLRLELPTATIQFLPLAGLPLFTQAMTVTPSGRVVVSRRDATIFEPTAVSPGFLTDAAASQLPAGSDTLGASTVESADVDRDGHPDLVVGTDTDVRIWLNDGSGAFVDDTAPRIAYPGDGVGGLELCDVDDDGDLDLLTAGGFDDLVSVPDRLWINDGSGHFAQDLTGKLPAGTGLTSRFEAGDVDGDGDLDLAVTVGPENHLGNPGGISQVYVNDGTGTFTAQPAFAALPWNDGATPTTAMRFGDVDGDGDLDLFVTITDTAGLVNDVGEPNRLLVNDGLGNFTDVTGTQILPLSRSDNSQDAAFADLDGDGDLDIVVCNSVLSLTTDESNDVLINQGGLQGGTEGVFVDDWNSFLEPVDGTDGIRLSVFPEDVDSDGDVDVLVTTHDFFPFGQQMLFLNEGGAQGGTPGTFTRQAWFDPGQFICFDAEVFDADGDGDVEIFLPANGVLGGDPLQQAQVRWMVNSTL